jgi:hypothetical protein
VQSDVENLGTVPGAYFGFGMVEPCCHGLGQVRLCIRGLPGGNPSVAVDRDCTHRVLYLLAEGNYHDLPHWDRYSSRQMIHVEDAFGVFQRPEDLGTWMDPAYDAKVC